MSGIFFRSIVIILFTSFACYAQQPTANVYGLYVVGNIETYYSLVEKESSKQLVDLEEFIPGIVLDIRYATANNFTGEPVYNIPKAFARLPVAKALKKIQDELKKENLGLKIYDAYRPYSVTVKFFKKAKNKKYVASPKKGSRHNRGCAVDLTLIDLRTGKEIAMPTGYDSFTEKAGHSYNNFPDEILRNRDKLKSIMVNNGFRVFNTEWWHYDFAGWQNFELMDISFEELAGKRN